jgi:SAM-dependent methyltransferase
MVEPIITNSTDVLRPDYQSPLGTLEHWNSAYLQEIEQLHNNPSELGDIWFGKTLQKKIVNYINDNFPNKKINILDIGCGNGVLLYKLSKKQFENLYGIDYSIQSINLAKEIIEIKEKKHNKKFKINFFQEDINNKSTNIINNIKFDIIHDKGSMDAFLMNKNNSIENYYKYLFSYSIKNKTVFIITSCNNTKEELLNKFSLEKGFKFLNEIKSKTFSFGGHEGNDHVTLIFQIII